MKILWIPHTGWHIPQRAHIFCRALAGRHEVHVTDWVADFTSLSDVLSWRYVRNFTYRYRNDGGIAVHGIPRIAPALFSPLLRRLNTAIFARAVRRLIVRARIDVVVGTFVLPPPQAPRLVFDMFDDNPTYWRSYGPNKAYADEIARTEQQYIQRADAVVVISRALREQARSQGAQGPVVQIPNGISLEQFPCPRGAGAGGPRSSGDRLVVGVLGNHDKPGELVKVIEAARMLESAGMSFVVAGRGRALPQAKQLVQQHGLTNVRFTGYVPQEQAAAVLSAFDVGLCPYSKTGGAEVSSPMRLLMYAAAGLPTVCTDLAAVRRMNFPNVVLVDDDAAALAEGIRSAAQLPRERPRAVEAYDLARLVARYEAVLRGDGGNFDSDEG